MNFSWLDIARQIRINSKTLKSPYSTIYNYTPVKWNRADTGEIQGVMKMYVVLKSQAWCMIILMDTIFVHFESWDLSLYTKMLTMVNIFDEKVYKATLCFFACLFFPWLAGRFWNVQLTKKKKTEKKTSGLILSSINNAFYFIDSLSPC